MDVSGGECHRMPPAVVAEDGEVYAVFPPVADDEFCGEWRPQIN